MKFSETRAQWEHPIAIEELGLVVDWEDPSLPPSLLKFIIALKSEIDFLCNRITVLAAENKKAKDDFESAIKDGLAPLLEQVSEMKKEIDKLIRSAK